MNYNKIIWFYNRFRKMSIIEIIYRVRIYFLQFIDKRKDIHAEVNYSLIDLDFFKALTTNLDKQIINYEFKKDIQIIVEKANLIMINKFYIFGKYEYQKKLDWHLDPVTHKEWPLEIYTQIDPRRSDFGDIKLIFEINRFYCMSILGMAYFATNNKKYADRVLFLVKDWILKNPYPYGINWISNIEMALRLINLIIALALIADQKISYADNQTISRFVDIHARHINKYRSKYSSNNNHAIAEALSLFLIGVYFKHLPNSKSYFEIGKKILEKEAKRQILQDGGSAEFSTSYLSFVLDFFLIFIFVCDKNFISYDEVVNQRLIQSANFISKLINKKNVIPNIGDQDSAIVIDFSVSNMKNFRSLLNTLSIIFDLPCLDTNFLDIKTYFFTGHYQNLNIKQESIIEQKDCPTSVNFLKNSGLSVINYKSIDNETLIICNASPLGMPPLLAHGHLDALSFYLSVNGIYFFIDAGTYSYNSNLEWRNYFRSNISHNTLTINQMDFSKQIAPFMYDKDYKILKNYNYKINGKYIWEASHNAYDVLGWRHNRKIIWDETRSEIIIKDEISKIDLNSKNCYVQICFHLHPMCSIVNKNSSDILITRENISLYFSGNPAMNREVVFGAMNPICGWYSVDFNSIEPTNTVIYSCQISKRKEILETVIKIIYNNPI